MSSEETAGPDQPKATGLGRRLLDGWMAIAGRFGFCQTMMILVLTYSLVIGPIGLVISLTRGDLLKKRGLKSGGSAWVESDSAKPDLERAKLMT